MTAGKSDRIVATMAAATGMRSGRSMPPAM
jgi:hypothetical protein